MNSLAQVIRFGVASHLRLHPAFVRDEQRLREDLGLTSIDLVWIVLRAESLDLSAGEFPIETLEHVTTVGDLIDAFDDWSSERDTLVDLETVDIDVEELSPDSWRFEAAPDSMR